MSPGFDRFKSFGHDELTAKHCYFRCSRPHDVDGIKMFDKDDQTAKHGSFTLMFYSLIIFMILTSFKGVNAEVIGLYAIIFHLV